MAQLIALVASLIAMMVASMLLLCAVAPPASAANGVRAKVGLKTLKPKSRARVKGEIHWTARAYSRDRIAKVSFYVDGRRKWTDRRAPFRFGPRNGRLDTTKLKDGKRRLTVIATSRSKRKSRHTVRVNVVNGAASAASANDLIPNVRPDDFSRIRVGWPEAAGTARSEVYRGATLVASRPAGISYYTDTMLWFGTEYSYTVRMFNAAGAQLESFGPMIANTGPLPPGGYPPAMPASSVWTAAIPAGHASYSRSAEFVNYLVARKTNANMPSREYGIPVFEAEANDPTFGPLACAYTCNVNESGPVPIPAFAAPDPGGDAHMSVISADGSIVWDYYKPYKNAQGAWSGTSAGVAVDVNGSGVVPKSLGGANAANFASIGGLIRPEELATGKISHALAMGVPGIASGPPACPAAKNAGVGGGIIPEGTRFQLDPALDVAALGLPAWQATVARALQTYGAYVRDNSGVIALYAETTSPTSGGRRYDGWAKVGNGINSAVESQTFSSRFPWERLRALNFTYC